MDAGELPCLIPQPSSTSSVMTFTDGPRVPTYHPEEGPGGQSGILLNSGQDTEDEADQNNEEAVRQGTHGQCLIQLPCHLPHTQHPTYKIFSAGNPRYSSANVLKHGMHGMETMYHVRTDSRLVSQYMLTLEMPHYAISKPANT